MYFTSILGNFKYTFISFIMLSQAYIMYFYLPAILFL